MRTAWAVAMGIVVGAASTVGIVHLRTRSLEGASTTPSTAPVVVAPPVPPPSIATVAPSPPPVATATPASTRVGGGRVDAPPPIYRCRAAGRTTYSDVACPEGKVVADGAAASGFDSRPSEPLKRLVADGRDAGDAAPEATRRTDARVPAANGSADCVAMRRQVEDIDRFLRYPHDARTLDDWRQTRQDIRTSMARRHC